MKVFKCLTDAQLIYHRNLLQDRLNSKLLDGKDDAELERIVNELNEEIAKRGIDLTELP